MSAAAIISCYQLALLPKGEIEFEEFLKMLLLRMERNMMMDKSAVTPGAL